MSEFINPDDYDASIHRVPVSKIIWGIWDN